MIYFKIILYQEFRNVLLKFNLLSITVILILVPVELILFSQQIIVFSYRVLKVQMLIMMAQVLQLVELIKLPILFFYGGLILFVF